MAQRDVDPLLPHEWSALRPELPREWATFFPLLLNTGIRTSEGLALRARDLWEEGPAFGIWVQRMKRRKARRDQLQIVDPRLQGELRQLAAKRRPLIFGHSRVAAWKALREACRRAGIRPLSPHQFRHTFSVEFARMRILDSRGEPIALAFHMTLLASALGHSSNRWVDIYFQPHPAELSPVTAQVGEVFSAWTGISKTVEVARTAVL